VTAARATGWPRTVTERLAERRYVVSGDRAYLIGTADGRFPQLGWHLRGEMGGVWIPPIKVLDGFWLTLQGRPLPPAREFRAHPGHVELIYPAIGGIELTRTEIVPDGTAAVLVGITLRCSLLEAESAELGVWVRSRLLPAYPWSDGQPNGGAAASRRVDIAEIDERMTLRFHQPATDWRALVRASNPPDAVSNLPPDGPVGTDAPAHAGGAWGSLAWRRAVSPGAPLTIWIAVAGSHRADAEAEAEAALEWVLADAPGRQSGKTAARRDLLARTRVGGLDAELAVAFDAAKLNLADLRRTVQGAWMRNRDTDGDTPDGSQPCELRGVGAGFPDYPHFFGGDACYAAYGLVASGQWDAAMDHLRLLRDASRAVNGRTGKVVHEVTFDGTVVYGTNADPGNADETPLVAMAAELLWRWSGDTPFRDEMYGFVRDGMHHLVDELDRDDDGYPEGEGGTERAGAGEETLAVCVTTWQGLRALERLATDCGDADTASWAAGRAFRLETTFDRDWWMPDARLYADSLNAENHPVLQRHWIGVMPMTAGLATVRHATAALDRLESATFTQPSGLVHTGGERRAGSDDDHRVWTIANAMMAVAEANYGRLEQALRYMRPIAAAIDLEMPGALPEVLPSPGYEVFGDLCDRLMFMQAWSAYGAQWPVVHHFLGIRPDAPARVLSVVPHLPSSCPKLSVRNLRVGDSAMSVTARRLRDGYSIEVDAPVAWPLFLGVRVDAADGVRAFQVDDLDVSMETCESPEGTAIGAWVGGGGRHRLVVMLS